MSIEVVCQIVLDAIAHFSKDSSLASRLIEQVQQEFEHLNSCRSVLADYDAFKVMPDYVCRFSRLMRAYGSKRRRTLPLVAATILCIAVEQSAMQQLAQVSLPDPEISALLQKLGVDEKDHFEIIAKLIAPWAASRASLLERMRAHVIMFQIALVTFVRWWPRQAAAYKCVGLKLDVFSENVLDYAFDVFQQLGLLFPRRVLLRISRIALQLP